MNVLKSPLIIIAGLAFIIIPIFLFFMSPNLELKLQEAGTSYKSGESAKTVAEREEKFNIALKNYLEVEKENDLRFSNGKLYYNIANSFFNLDEFAYAVYYYYKAIALRPLDEKVERNLAVALNKLGLKEEPNDSLKVITFFSPLTRKLQAFSLSWILFVVLASLYIWKEKPIYKQLSGTFLLVSAFALSWIIFSALFSPKEGVLIQGVELKMDAGDQFAAVREEPLSAGLKVKILDFDKEREYYKIETSQDEIGFVPKNTLRVI